MDDTIGSIAEAVPGTNLVLSASLDLNMAEPLAIALREQVQAGAVLLDGAAVEHVSTPCLQILAAAATSALGRGLSFHLHHASVALRDAIGDLGLSMAIPLEQ